MTIQKAIISTALFFLFISIIDFWTLLDLVIDISLLTTVYYRLVNGIIEVTLVAWFLYKVYGVEGIIPRKTALYYYLVAFVVGGCYTLIQTPLNFLYNLALNTDYKVIYQLDLPKFLTTKSIAIILLGPIAEELFFRHHIQKRLQNNYKPYVAIGLSSLLFALIHLNYKAILYNAILHNKFVFEPHHAYITLFGGLLTGLLYYKSKSIGPPIIFHIMWNLISILT